jgi:hypothetical protein
MPDTQLSTVSRQPSATRWVELHDYAAATGQSVNAVMNKISRGTLPAHLFPSERHAGKKISRIAAHRLDEAVQREMEAFKQRFAAVSPDDCLAALHARWVREYRPAIGQAAAEAKAQEMVETARRRHDAIQQYRLINPKSVLIEANRERAPASAVLALCERMGVTDRVIRTWQARFDTALGRGAERNTPDALQRAFKALLPAQGGNVREPDSDGRVKLGAGERLAIQGLWLGGDPQLGAEPNADHVWRRLLASCIRCHQGPMVAVHRGFRGRYGAHRCQCGFSLCYSTVLRITKETPRSVATLARRGLKEFTDKYGRYAERDWSHATRSSDVYGDHHECDVHLYDPRRLRNTDKSPRYIRLWLSAWMDVATDCVGYVFAERANGELLALAYRAYIRRFGVPLRTWHDCGKDYLGKHFDAVCTGIGTEQHPCLPSGYGKDSHARSKPIERFFGTFERDFCQVQPGWLSKDPVERKHREEFFLHPMRLRHARAVEACTAGVSPAGPIPGSPFLTVEQFIERATRWIEEQYHRLPISRTDMAPLDAFESSTAPLQRVSDRALDVLMLQTEPDGRVIRGNGVTIDAHTYWSRELWGHEGKSCDVRFDPQDRSKVIVLLEGRAIIAYGAVPAGTTTEDIRREATLKRDQRRVIEDAIAVRRLAARGITPLDQVLAERAPVEIAEPVRRAVNAVPIITEAHSIAERLARTQPARNWPGTPAGAVNPTDRAAGPAPLPATFYDLTHSEEGSNEEDTEP